MTVSPAGNTIIPNSWQCPNLFTDELMHLLTGEEWKVLSWAAREILGWRESIASRRNRISLSQFAAGKQKRGVTLAHGTGLSKGAVIVALGNLSKFRILIPEGDATTAGQMYYLQEDASLIDWDGLEARKCTAQAARKERVIKASAAAVAKRQAGEHQSSGSSHEPPYTGTSGNTDGGGVVRPTNQYQSMGRTTTGSSDGHTETQGNPVETQEGATAPLAPDIPPHPRQARDPLDIEADFARHRAQMRAFGNVDVGWCWREDLVPLARAFVADAHQPVKKERARFVADLESLREAGFNAQDVTDTITYMRHEHLTIKSPGSLLGPGRDLKNTRNPQTLTTRPLTMTELRAMRANQ